MDRFSQQWKLDGVPDEYYETYDYSFRAFIYTLLNPTPDQCTKNSSNFCLTSASTLRYAVSYQYYGFYFLLPVFFLIVALQSFLFGLLVTIIGVILQFAADKITSHVTSLVIVIYNLFNTVVVLQRPSSTHCLNIRANW